jgi:hypothetical protein
MEIDDNDGAEVEAAEGEARFPVSAFFRTHLFASVVVVSAEVDVDVDTSSFLSSLSLSISGHRFRPPESLDAVEKLPQMRCDNVADYYARLQVTELGSGRFGVLGFRRGGFDRGSHVAQRQGRLRRQGQWLFTPDERKRCRWSCFSGRSS